MPHNRRAVSTVRAQVMAGDDSRCWLSFFRDLGGSYSAGIANVRAMDLLRVRRHRSGDSRYGCSGSGMKSDRWSAAQHDLASRQSCEHYLGAPSIPDPARHEWRL